MEDNQMAKKSRLTRVAVRIGTAMGKADQKVQKVAKPGRLPRRNSTRYRSKSTPSNANYRKPRSVSSAPSVSFEIHRNGGWLRAPREEPVASLFFHLFLDQYTSRIILFANCSRL